MSGKWASILITVLLLFGVSAQAQFVQDPNDHGNADTVDFVFSVVPDVATAEMHLQVELWVYSDGNNVASATVGFSWDNPNFQMDSAFASPEAIAGFNLQRFLYKSNSLAVTNTDQQFLFFGARITGDGVPSAPDRRMWATWYFTASSWNAADSMVLDTNEYNSGAILKFVDHTNQSYKPYWTGKKVVRDSSYSVPSNLVISEDTLFFTGIEGGDLPPTQTFEVTSDHDPLSFTLFETSSWIVKSPTTATTPQVVTVEANTSGQTFGSYFDSIRVESGSAANSPQYVFVALELSEPPPIIAAAPMSFTFNAVAGDVNPAPKMLAISNVGGQVLNWTVTNTELWLTLTPGLGTDAGDVELAVDITGLAFGEYFDTVIVSDPAASNDPVAVPVHLSIGSDLPIIEIDSPINYWPVAIAELPIFLRSFGVRNGGAGVMNFWVEETSTVIIGLSPSASIAPDSVEVTFKTTEQAEGSFQTDTVWVHSNEAINSPQPVVLRLKFSNNPAFLNVSAPSINFQVFECSQGALGTYPSFTFSVTNTGGANPMPVQLQYESELFSVDKPGGTAPESFTVQALPTGLSVGNYSDTIFVTSIWAINGPQFVVVNYNVVPGTETPQMTLSRSTLTIPYQEGTGTKPLHGFDVSNLFAGCMPWTINEEIDWLTPVAPGGDVPGDANFWVNPAGYTLGEYADSLTVVAPTSGNSPLQVNLLLRVWRLHGDVTYDGIIDIFDITSLIGYLFMQGPAPQPTIVVGDGNCDGVVDVADLTLFIAYLFESGDIPCGNPFKKK